MAYQGHAVTQVDLVVGMPVGPDNSGVDTIESVLHYCTGSVVVLAVDDSSSSTTASQLRRIEPPCGTSGPQRSSSRGSRGYVDSAT